MQCNRCHCYKGFLGDGYKCANIDKCTAEKSHILGASVMQDSQVMATIVPILTAAPLANLIFQVHL